MAINQILSIPDWKKYDSFTNSNTPPSGFSQIYPGPDKYWYVKDSAGVVKRFALDYQFGNGFDTSVAATDSLVNYRVDINAGAGLTFSYDGINSELLVAGLTLGNFYVLNSFTQGYFLSYNTASNAFEWSYSSSATVSGTSGSIAKFTAGNAVGDSLLREIDGVIFMGATPSITQPYIGLGISQSVNIGGKIYLNNNLNRFLDGTSSVELRTTSDFLVSQYPLYLGTSSISRVIDAKIDSSTYSETFGYDRQIEFLSGLVSVNQRQNYPPLFVNAVSPGLTGVSPSHMIRTPTFSFGTSDAFLGRITGTFGVALGLSGGGIQIKDGTEGQYKVLVSSTTQGHGIWATMVEIGTRQRIPIYQRTGDFDVAGVITFTDSVQYPVSGPTYGRTFSVSLSISTQSILSSYTQSLNNTIDFRVPNVGATGTIDFIMSRGSQSRYGTLALLDENELVGSATGGAGIGRGLLIKDLSNTGIDYSNESNTEVNSRHNATLELLTSAKNPGFQSSLFEGGLRVQQAWNFSNPLYPTPSGWTGGWTNSVPTHYQVRDAFSRLSRPGTVYFPRNVYEDSIYFRLPQTTMTSPSLGTIWANPANKSKDVNDSTLNADGLDTQIIRKKSTIFINQNWYPVNGGTTFQTTSSPNVIYEFEFNRMGFTGSNLRMDTILGKYIRLESGEYSGSITQSTGLFVNPQFGSWKGSGVLMTASRMVGVQVAQEVGVLTYQPNGYVDEAYDFVSARVSGGSTNSGIGKHVGFLAQSKLMGIQWDPMGRRTYDFGQQLGTFDDVDRAASSTSRTTGRSWPTYSFYPNKPWAFFAEKDKSNFGGGVLIDIGATLSTTLNAYLEIQGVTGIYNTFASSRSMVDLDGSVVTVSGESYGPLLPQILLRPGLTPSSLQDGSLFYTTGYLGFVDGGNTYNLLSTQSIPPAGLTGQGINGYVPVWVGGDALSGSSSIYISEVGSGGVGIKTPFTPFLPLQVSTSSGTTASLRDVAIGVSGSILYTDGSQGSTGSVLMANAEGKTNLFPLVLPGPGLTTVHGRVGGSYSSGYLPLYVGKGGVNGASGSSEYQLGPIMMDEYNNEISLLIRPQSQFASANPTGSNAGQRRTMTFVVPTLSSGVPTTFTSSVEFLMGWGSQTVNGVKTFENKTVVGIVNMGDPFNIGFQLRLTGNQLHKHIGANRPFSNLAGAPNYAKSTLVKLNSDNTLNNTSGVYSRAALSEVFDPGFGAYSHKWSLTSQSRNYLTTMNQSIGRFIDNELANNYIGSISREDIPNFIGEFHFSKVSTTQSNLNHPSTFISFYNRSEFGHNFATATGTIYNVGVNDTPLTFATSSVRLMTNMFVNSQLGGLTWSYASATYSIGVYARQDVDSGRISRAYDFFASRMAASSSLSRIDNHVGFYAQSKVFGTTSLEPTGRIGYNFDTTQPWPFSFSYGWTSGNNAPWSFFAESDKALFGGGILLMGTNSEVVRAVNATATSYEDMLSVYRDGNLPSWLTIQEPTTTRPQISLLPYTKRATAIIQTITYIPNGVDMQITTNYPIPGTIVVPTFSTSGSSTTTGNTNQFVNLINQTGRYTAFRSGPQTMIVSGPLYAGTSINSSTFSFSTASSNIIVGAFSGGIDTPIPLTTSDGDMWHTGTALYFKSGGATYNLLLESKGATGPTGAAGQKGADGLRAGPYWTYQNGWSNDQPLLGPTTLSLINSQITGTGYGVSTGCILFNSRSTSPPPNGLAYTKMYISTVDTASRYQTDYLLDWKPGDYISVNLQNPVGQTDLPVVFELGTHSQVLGEYGYIEYNVTKLSGSSYPGSNSNGSRLVIQHYPIGNNASRNGVFWYFAKSTNAPFAYSGAGSSGLNAGSLTFNSFDNSPSPTKLYISESDNTARDQSTYIESWRSGDILTWNLKKPDFGQVDVPIAILVHTVSAKLGTPLNYYEIDITKLSGGIPDVWNASQEVVLLHQPIGATGSSTIVSLGLFSQSNFFTDGASLSNTTLTLGAASTMSAGLVHTGSQTFSGDKTFYGNVFVGPTSNSGLFLFTSTGSKYSGFIGATGLSSNVKYQLPSQHLTDRFLKLQSIDGEIHTLVWGTVSTGTSPNSIETGPSQILVGDTDGFGFTYSNKFEIDLSTMNFEQGCNNQISAASANRCQNTIIGGQDNCINSGFNSGIFGGDSGTISFSCNSIVGGGTLNIVGTGSNNSAIIGGCSNTIIDSAYSSSILGGQSNIIGTSSNRSVVIGGQTNILCNSDRSLIISGAQNYIYDTCNSGIVGGSNNLIATSSHCSLIIGGNNNCIINSSSRSVILGGSNLLLDGNTDVVLVPNLRIQNVLQKESYNRLLVQDSSTGEVAYRDVSGLPFGTGGGGGATISGFGICNDGLIQGATISYAGGFANITFGAATKQFFGIVSTASQVFGGTKSFSNSIFVGDTTSTQPSGIFLNNWPGATYTGFVSPKALDKNYVYQLPSVKGLTGQSLMISSIDDGTTTATISTNWSWPRLGVGLTQSSGGTISLVSLSPNNIVKVTTTPFTVSLADNNKLLDVSTGDNLYRITPPLDFKSNIPGASTSAAGLDYVGFEFRVRKTDLSDGVVTIQIGTNSDLNPYVNLTKQNQMVGIKYDSASQSWTGYLIDSGYIAPNTVLGNFGNTHSYVDEYQVIDLNDSVQKAPNYTEGSFTNDWLSGVVYSSFNPWAVSTSLAGTPLSLLNNTQYLGLASASVSGLTIPAFALTKGKHLKVYMAGTYSKASITSTSQIGFKFNLAGTTINSFTYSKSANTARGTFELEYNMKIRNGGLSGSVFGSGRIGFEELGSPGIVSYFVNNFTQSYINDLNLSTNATFDIQANNPNLNGLSLTVHTTTIERLA